MRWKRKLFWNTGGTPITTPVVKMVTVNVDELDTRGVTVSKTELEVGEGTDARNTYTLALNSAPADEAEVTVTISSSSPDVTVDPAQMTFTSGNWASAQPVTVTAVGDDDAEPNASVTLSHKVRGADYGKVSPDNVKVTVREENTRGIVTAPPAMLPTMEEGQSGTYTVRLNSQPTATVTVQVRSDSSDVTVKPSELKFTTYDWNRTQTVKVRAGHDDDSEDDPVVTLTHTASGGGYDPVSEKVRVAITDDDESQKKGVRVHPGALTLNEGGATHRYMVVLLTEPTGTVKIQVEPQQFRGPDPSDPPVSVMKRLMVEPRLLTFTRGAWNVPQEVRISAPEMTLTM